MSEADRDALRACWRQLSRRNSWELVADEATLLDEAAAELATLSTAKTPNERACVAVWRAYSVLLYRGLWYRQDRAAQELWMAMVRSALKRGHRQTEAEELAQEVIARVLEKLDTVRVPQGLISWALMIFRTVQRDYGKQAQPDQPLQGDGDELPHEPGDPADMAQEVEQQLVDTELLTLLRAKLPNHLERVTLLRIVVLGDHPRDVARDLGLPLHRTRVAKHRALNRLRGDEAFMGTLRAIVGDTAQHAISTGVDDDDE